MFDLRLYGQVHHLQAAEGKEKELADSIQLIESLAQKLEHPTHPNRDRFYVMLLLALANEYNALAESSENISKSRLKIEELCDKIEHSLAKSREYL